MLEWGYVKEIWGNQEGGKGRYFIAYMYDIIK